MRRRDFFKGLEEEPAPKKTDFQPGMFTPLSIWRRQVRPNTDRLVKRLKKPQYSRLVKKSEQFTGSTADEFYLFLREKVQRMEVEDIEGPLADSLPENELAGLMWRVRAELAKL